MERSRADLRHKRGIIVDLDGTLYRGNTAIPGAVEWLKRVREQAGVVFLTNNSKWTPEQVACRLQRLGFQADTRDVLTSAMAAARYIRETWGSSPLLVLGEEGLWQAVQEAGLTAFRPGEIEPERVSVVLQGIHQSCTYRDLSELCRAIRAGARFVLTNPDRALPTDQGLVPGAGAIASLIEAATGVAPVVVGKPEGRMVEQALHLLNLAKDQVVMVGDNLETDIEAGRRAGVDTVLVLTGYTRREDLGHSRIRPDWVLDDLSQWFT
ncbi:MAG: HAD-IIA family hydrolase [Alicyclobacillaceae bacterium]|nr:HAD-IIA family hydrolase [Alicyclobacillaceae bacterium]